jgi:hypothetical protein
MNLESAARRVGKRGLTLFELALGLSGITVVGLTATYLLAPALGGDGADAAVRDAAQIQQAAEHWRKQNPEGCPTLSVLLDERELTARTSVEDPWGGRYKVRCEQGQISVTSAGKDRRVGTEDDVRYPRS